MGVPGLFTYLIQSYPSDFTRDTIPTIDSIYLDGNALLYPIAETTKVPDEIAKILLEVAQMYADHYGCMCHLYMDGAAHMGKIRQQRLRRFLYEPVSLTGYTYPDVGERHGQVSVDMSQYHYWSPAMFTPGTEVMESIHVYVLAHIHLYPGIGRYSSYHEYGEGEHKILMHIKESSLNSDTMTRTAIVGKDADLILLAMSITQEEGWNVYPYIIRHNDRVIDGGTSNGYLPSDPVYVIDIPEMRRDILTSSRIKTESIWNFIIASFFIGNDFLPPVPEMSNVYRSIPLILSLSPSLYVRETRSISVSGLMSFISSLSHLISSDTEMLKDAYKGWNQGRDIADIYSFIPIYLFHMTRFTPDTDKIISTWMMTIQWIFHYYHDGIDTASVAWQYPLVYAPSIGMLDTYIIDQDKWNEGSLIVTEKLPPLTPRQALSAVLPIWLHDLIPEDIRERLSQYQQYYPYAFDIIDPTGDPIIPMIPYDVVSQL